MDTIALGRTGLQASVAGLGCGGASRLGLRQGSSPQEAVRLVRACMDRGVNLIDTAAAYGTEPIVGEAVSEVDRSKVILATKASIAAAGEILPAERVIDSLNDSLRNLRTDYVDIFFLHAVKPGQYSQVTTQIVPALLAERQKGKFRFIGITETPPNDPHQDMLSKAVQDNLWDVMMVGFHMLNQRAQQRVFPQARRAGIGTLSMFVVRQLFGDPVRLRAVFQELENQDLLPHSSKPDPGRLEFLVHPGGAENLVDAAYRFARHAPGSDVILFGTGNLDHARANIDSI